MDLKSLKTRYWRARSWFAELSPDERKRQITIAIVLVGLLILVILFLTGVLHPPKHPTNDGGA